MSQETMTSTNSNDEWLHYYYQQTTLNPDQSHAIDSSTPSKPIRRRSRASKKTPTTLLNANAKNFRALVQKFTGCPNISLANQKGPVNLNFGVENAAPMVEPLRNYHGYSRPEMEAVPQNQPQQQHSYNLQENSYYFMGSQDHQSTYYPALCNNTITSSELLFNPSSNGFVPEENYELAHSGLIFE